jgi:glycosyltransferase involved in cell wall biosynthesis
MDVSVLICTYNRAASLRQTLQSCCALVIPEGVTWELLLVDNNSSDVTMQLCAEFANKLPLRYIFEPRQGKSYALNTAVQSATGELVVFTDDDVSVTAQWIAELWKAAASNHKVSFFGGPISVVWESPPPKWIADHWFWRVITVNYSLGEQDVVLSGKVSSTFFGANQAFRRSVFQQGFEFATDLNLGVTGNTSSAFGRVGGEDGDIQQRLFAARHQAMYVTKALVHHRTSLVRTTERYFRTYCRATGIEWVRNGHVPNGQRQFLHVPLFIWFKCARHTIRYFLTRWTRPARVWLAEEYEMARYQGMLLEYRRRHRSLHISAADQE